MPPVPPPAPPLARPPRRRALVAGLGTLGAAVVALAVILATSPFSGHHQANLSTVGGDRASREQPPGGFGTIPAESGTPHAGTVSFALPPGDTPNWILPLASDTYESVYNVLDFDYEMWRPLYWPDKGASAQIDPALSLAGPPVWSDNGKTVTITVNPAYKWSDGKPVSAQDVAFDIDLIKAAVKENPANWALYSQGNFPDNLAGLSTPDARTLVLNLSAPVNPNWFYEDELEALQPMPAHAWARAAAGGPTLDYTDPGNAKKIYDYLFAQSKATGTWTSSPLWKVVDGPYRLLSYSAGNGDSLAANPGYGGPDSHMITKLTQVTFASNSAEFSALRAGSIDVALVPPEYWPLLGQVRSGGYNVFGYPDFGWTYAVYNFKDTTGNFNHVVAQLYFRQAMAHLQDQQGYIRTFMSGAGSQDYGPVPPIPANKYTPANASNTYPFSVAAARSLLASHGWNVVPNGADTCARPGSGPGQCGDGIPAGTRLAFNLVYSNSSALTGQELGALAAAAKQAGIEITLQENTLANIITDDNNLLTPSNENKWAMAEIGAYTQVAYPTTITVFNTTGSFNIGSYSDPQADKLINASVNGSDPNAAKSEAAYLTTQQPALFQPTPDSVFAWTKRLSGPRESFAGLTQFYLTPEVWYFTS
jgi:peptide/nickel transport system substrate-binding protein